MFRGALPIYLILMGVYLLLPPLRAQNLVLNPSFETISSCPQGPSQFSFAVNWSEPFIISTTDTCSTTDLYNSCSFIGMGVPNNILGNEPARTGNGYAGIITYEGFGLIGCGSLFGTGWREYVQAELSSPMTAGQQYCISFHVSLADNVKWATGDFGLYLSPTKLAIPCTSVGSSSALQPLGYNPQLQWTGGPITNRNGWTRLQWSYTALGGERYLVFGNFKGDANTTFVCVDSAAFNPYAYYYIDDVEVIATTVCCPVITIQISSQSPVSCFGGSDGSVTVNASGGAAPYTFTWSTGTTGPTLSGRPAGNYSVTATDAGGCTVARTINISQPNALTVNVSSSSGGCGTSASASPSGGTGPYSYLWSTGATLPVISNLATGTYSVTVTDSKGCTATGSISVTQTTGLALSISSTPSACGVCDGTATITPSGGTPPYTYQWSDGQTTQTATNLCPGTYTVTVTDNGGGGSSTVFWSENFNSGGSGWTLNLNGPGPNDANANQWVINNNRNDCTQCPPSGSGGNYLHVTCSSGVECFSSAGSCVYSVGVPFFSNAATDKFVSSPIISTVGKTNMTLRFWYVSDGEVGRDYGLVRLSSDGGTTWTDLPTQYAGVSACTQATIAIPAQYENIPAFRIGFRWINDNNTNGNDPPFLIDDIELEAASVSTACTATATVNISPANSPAITLTSKSDVRCFAGNDGAVQISVSGGIPPYTFQWAHGAGTQNLSGIGAGHYALTVTDNAGCTDTFSIWIQEPDSALTASAIIADAGCEAANGAINLTPAGGTPPYSYQWSNGSNTEDLSNLPAGNYTVTVTDSKGCTVSADYTVNAPGGFSVTLTPDSASCVGAIDGAVYSSITNGSPPFKYLWNTGDTTADLTQVQAGLYSLTVTDGNQCSSVATVMVGAPQPMTFTASITQVLCSDDADGGIKLNPIGGIPPYTANWSNADTGLSITNLTPGIYTATVTDANGCTKDTAISLEAVSLYTVSATVSPASCDNSPSGSIELQITNATTAPYHYVWNTGDTLPELVNLMPGVYSFTVSDSLHCLRSDTVTVPVENNLQITATITDASCPDAADGAIEATVSGGNEPYMYYWNTGDSTASITQLTPDRYLLTVTDADNCQKRDTFEVHVDLTQAEKCDTLWIYDVFSPNGDGVNDIWYIDGLDKFPDAEVQIFNRWGNKVFEARPYKNDWDGRTKEGKELPSASYYYILRLHNAAGSIHSGSITLIR